MNTNLPKMRTIKMQINKTEIDCSAWLTKGNYPTNCLVIATGDARIQTMLDAEKAEALIDLLHQHIANIKAVELEAIALQTELAV